jgi:hypothetical protein
METLELLKQAISMKKPISYEYFGENSVRGTRYGNPHIIFETTKIHKPQIHIYKTGGVCSKPGPLPDFRAYNIEDIINVTILDEQPSFIAASGYNPFNNMYKRTLYRL